MMMHRGTKWFPWCFFLVIGLLIHKSFAATNSTSTEPNNSTTDGKPPATAPNNSSGNTSYPSPSVNNTSNSTSPNPPPPPPSNTNTSASLAGNDTSNSTAPKPPPPPPSNTNTSASLAGNDTSNSTAPKPPPPSNTNASSSLAGNNTSAGATGMGTTPEVSRTALNGTDKTSAGASGASGNGSESASTGNGTVSASAGASSTDGSRTTPAVTGTAPTGSGASTAGSGSASPGSATASAGSTDTGTGSTGTGTTSTRAMTGSINSTYNSTTLAKPVVQAISLRFTSMEYSDALCTKGTSLFNQFAEQVKAGIDAMGSKSMGSHYVSNSSAMYACYQGSVIANTTFSTTTTSGAQILADNIVEAGPNGTFTNLTVDVTSVLVAVAPNITQNSKTNLANAPIPFSIQYLWKVTLPAFAAILAVVVVFLMCTAGDDAILWRICKAKKEDFDDDP